MYSLPEDGGRGEKGIGHKGRRGGFSSMFFFFNGFLFYLFFIFLFLILYISASETPLGISFAFHA